MFAFVGQSADLRLAVYGCTPRLGPVCSVDSQLLTRQMRGASSMAQCAEAGNTGAVSLALRIALVTMVAAGVVAIAGCASPPACTAAAGSCAPPIVHWPPFVTTINGRVAVRTPVGPVPSFRVRPGERLVIQVAVKVPKHVLVKALWLGICKDSWGWGPGDRPTGMNPILTYSRQRLAAGVHTFGMRWRFPEGGLQASLYLCTAWLAQNPPSGAAGAIAVLALN